jgi:hypothetical protein
MAGACQSGPTTSAGSTVADARPAPLRALPEACLQHLYLGCSHEAMQGQLAVEEIAACSVVYETLLTSHFNGDFAALVAWSRSQPDAPPPPTVPAAAPNDDALAARGRRGARKMRRSAASIGR